MFTVFFLLFLFHVSTHFPLDPVSKINIESAGERKKDDVEVESTFDGWQRLELGHLRGSVVAVQ